MRGIVRLGSVKAFVCTIPQYPSVCGTRAQCGVVLVYKPILCERRMRQQLWAGYQPSEATNSKFILRTPFHTRQKMKVVNLKSESGLLEK